jgi:hypothetical protein
LVVGQLANGESILIQSHGWNKSASKSALKLAREPKGTVEVLNRSLAKELGPRNIAEKVSLGARK